MDANLIMQMVGSLGFPIVCVGACFWYINKSTEQHKAEMDKMSDAINNNTLVMQKLIDKLGND